MLSDFFSENLDEECEFSDNAELIINEEEDYSMLVSYCGIITLETAKILKII